jgi:hypothetical protein
MAKRRAGRWMATFGGITFAALLLLVVRLDRAVLLTALL